MPWGNKRPCAKPGCPNLVKSGYCDEHRREKWRNDERPSSTRRGYDTDWSKFRKWYLARHPFCTMCEREGRTKTADMIHHVKPLAEGGAKFDENNLQSICSYHHRKLHGVGGNGMKNGNAQTRRNAMDNQPVKNRKPEYSP